MGTESHNGKNRRRAIRRHHAHRMLQRAKRVILTWYASRDSVNEEDIYLWVRKRRDNMQICSCHSCGNRRSTGWTSSIERLTLAERRALDDYCAYLSEINK